MKMVSTFVLAAFALVAASAAIADTDPVATREALMKSNGASVKLIVSTIKGAVPYDADKVIAALKAIESNTTTFPTLFPAGSETGGDNLALPKIWQTPDDFKAKAEKTVADAKAAEAVAGNGVDALKAAFGAVGKDCGACHDDYRLKK